MRNREMKLKFLVKIGPLLLIAGLYLLGTHLYFSMQSQEVVGNVMEVTGYNDQCKRGNASARGSLADHECTKYKATVAYQTAAGQPVKIIIDAGKKNGLNQPVSSASYKVGDTAMIKYNPNNPDQHYSEEDIFIKLMISGILILLGSVLSYFGFANSKSSPSL